MFVVNSLSYFKECQDTIFWAFALFGTTLFFLRVCFSWLLHSDHENSEGFNSDVSHDDLGSDNCCNHHESPKETFKILSIHSISGFFMMFGWTGLASIKQLGYSPLISSLIALFIGLITMFTTGLIFKGASLLVNPGSQFNIKKAVGLIGIVYQCIPRDGSGKIQLEIDGVSHEILAQSLDKNAIESFKHVKIVQIIDHETVIVKEISS